MLHSTLMDFHMIKDWMWYLCMWFNFGKPKKEEEKLSEPAGKYPAQIQESPGRGRALSASVSSEIQDDAKTPVMWKEWSARSLSLIPLRLMHALLCQCEISERIMPQCPAWWGPASIDGDLAQVKIVISTEMIFLWQLSSYPEQRDVHLAQVVFDGGIHTVLSLEVKKQPGHSVHCDVGHHSERVPTQGEIWRKKKRNRTLFLL